MAILANSTPLPAFLPAAKLPTNRRALDFYIEALIHLSEQLDGDADLEPSLAGIDGGPTDDREGDYLAYSGLGSFTALTADQEPDRRRAGGGQGR